MTTATTMPVDSAGDSNGGGGGGEASSRDDDSGKDNDLVVVVIIVVIVLVIFIAAVAIVLINPFNKNKAKLAAEPSRAKSFDNPLCKSLLHPSLVGRTQTPGLKVRVPTPSLASGIIRIAGRLDLSFVRSNPPSMCTTFIPWALIVLT